MSGQDLAPVARLTPATRPSESAPAPIVSKRLGPLALTRIRGLTLDEMRRPDLWSPPAPGLNLDSIKAALADLETLLTPATPAEITFHVGYLIGRYQVREQRSVEMQMEADDWRAALAHWPLDILLEACRRWRWGPPARPFPPRTPGEVRALGQPILTARASLAWRLTIMADALTRAQPKTPLAPGDLAALREKLNAMPRIPAVYALPHAVEMTPERQAARAAIAARLNPEQDR